MHIRGELICLGVTGVPMGEVLMKVVHVESWESLFTVVRRFCGAIFSCFSGSTLVDLPLRSATRQFHIHQVSDQLLLILYYFEIGMWWLPVANSVALILANVFHSSYETFPPLSASTVPFHFTYSSSTWPWPYVSPLTLYGTALWILL